LQSIGHSHQVCQRIRCHLPHHLTAMSLDGDLADVQLAPHLLVQQTRDHKCHHLALTWREGIIAAPKRLQLQVVAPSGFAALDRLADCPQQIVVVERFGQEVDGTASEQLF
jgi:hypothetical protein